MSKLTSVCFAFACWLASLGAHGQTGVTLEGYVFEDNNSGYLNEVTVRVTDADTEEVYGEPVTDREGFFALEVPRGRDLLLRATKKAFEPAIALTSSRDLAAAAERLYVKIPMGRQPGYRLEVTLAEERDPGAAPGSYDEVDAIQNALVEVYNNTLDSVVLVLRDHRSPYFSYHLEQGNHYTLLIRSPGYFTKRIESYVNIDDCILCMDGVSEIGPGVSDNLAHGHEVGTLLANVELRPMRIDSVIGLDNIYYEYDADEITAEAAAELDEVVEMLALNPSVEVELGSHTDSRGPDSDNMELSQRRAQSAVDYLVARAIDRERLTARGYGETRITNVCVDDVECSEEEHAANRRTELRVTGFTRDPFAGKSLAEIIAAERAAAGEGGSATAATRAGRQPARRTTRRAAAASLALEAMKGDLSATEDSIDVTSPEAIAGDDAAASRVREARVEALRDGSAATAPASLNPSPPPPPRRPRPSADATEVASALREAYRPVDSSARAAPRTVSEPVVGLVRPLASAAGDNFSGYRVLVFQSDLPLGDENGELFFQYGTLEETELADGSYGYVSGAFRTRAAAMEYLTEVSTLFPDARILRYVNGFITEAAR